MVWHSAIITIRNSLSLTVFRVCVILSLPYLVFCCENGFYWSYYLDGCDQCPGIPSLDCRNPEKVHLGDRDSCLSSCITASVTPGLNHEEDVHTTEISRLPPISKPPLPIKPTSDNTNKHLRRYIGNIKLDHFIVLIGVVVGVSVIIAFIAWTLVDQARNPQRPRFIFAGYNLTFDDELPDKGGDQTNQPQQVDAGVQLTVRTTE